MKDVLSRDVDICAVIDAYQYLDMQSRVYEGQPLRHIIGQMSLYKNITAEQHKQIEQLQEIISSNEDIGNMIISNQSAVVGFSNNDIVACTFTSQDGKVFVSYRGTGDGKWVDNGIAMSHENSNMQEKAKDYFDFVVDNKKLTATDNVTITGHSKGGNEAQYVTLASTHGDCIDQCISIDGQGFSKIGIEKLKDMYGEEWYQNQVAKMTSVNGENDYVHDLGTVIIPVDKTYFIETPDASDISGYHDLFKMFDTSKVWGQGRILNVETVQGDIGKIAKTLSQNMNTLSDDDFEDIAMTIMSAIESLMPYSGNPGGKFLKGSDGNYMTFEEYWGFFANGIPVILKSISDSEEAKRLLKETIKSTLESIKNEYGDLGVAVAVFLAILATAVATEVWAFFYTYECIIEFVDSVKDFMKSAKHLVLVMKEYALSIVDSIKQVFNENFNQGYITAMDHPFIRIDTNKMSSIINELRSINKRVVDLDVRMNALYWEVGFSGLLYLLKADVMTSHSRRIDLCINYLHDTIVQFEAVESKLLLSM